MIGVILDSLGTHRWYLTSKKLKTELEVSTVKAFGISIDGIDVRKKRNEDKMRELSKLIHEPYVRPNHSDVYEKIVESSLNEIEAISR